VCPPVRDTLAIKEREVVKEAWRKRQGFGGEKFLYEESVNEVDGCVGLCIRKRRGGAFVAMSSHSGSSHIDFERHSSTDESVPIQNIAPHRVFQQAVKSCPET
jgi:hypothetical protein